MGFDWPAPEPVFDKVIEEVDELREAASVPSPDSAVAAELGDLLFACVNLARHLGVDPEAALRGANAKFTARFHHVEAALAAAGRKADAVGLAELDRLWEEAKRAERPRVRRGNERFGARRVAVERVEFKPRLSRGVLALLLPPRLPRHAGRWTVSRWPSDAC